MIAIRLLILSLFLCVVNLPAHAMMLDLDEQEQIEATGFDYSQPTTKKQQIAHGKRLLEGLRFTSFITHAKKIMINPNYFITKSGYTALMLAVVHDRGGKIVKELLDCGSLYLPRDEEGVLLFLRMAIKANNYNAVMNINIYLCIFNKEKSNENDKEAIKKYLETYEPPQKRPRYFAIS